MTSDEGEIRSLIGAWAEAVNAGDIHDSAHTNDLVMFDVPPPDDGLRLAPLILRLLSISLGRRSVAQRWQA